MTATPMLPRERCDFSAIVDRPPLKLPGDARLAAYGRDESAFGPLPARPDWHDDIPFGDTSGA